MSEIKKSQLTEDQWEWYVEGCAEEILKILYGTDPITLTTLRQMFQKATVLVKKGLNEDDHSIRSASLADTAIPNDA